MPDTPAVETVTEDTPEVVTSPADTPSEDSPETKEQRPSRARERIHGLVEQNRAAVEFADMQKTRAEDAEARLKALQTPAEAAGMPKLADFETPEQWAEAATVYTNTQASKQVKEQVATALQQFGIDKSAAEREQGFQAALVKEAEKHDDFWDVVSDPSATFLNGALLDAVKDFDNPGALIYHLNSNPAEARKIATLGSPARIGAALGKITLGKPSQSVTTEVPDPPGNLGGGPSGDVDPTKMSTKEYIEWRVQVREARRHGAS